MSGIESSEESSDLFLNLDHIAFIRIKLRFRTEPWWRNKRRIDMSNTTRHCALAPGNLPILIGNIGRSH